MRAMPAVPGIGSGRMVSAGAVLVSLAGLSLYQLTSLVLGPAGSRQLDLSLAMPAVDVQEQSETAGTSATLVVGALATPATPLARVPASGRAPSVPAAKPSSHPGPTAAPTPPSHSSGKELDGDD